jgi:hypothetical protein
MGEFFMREPKSTKPSETAAGELHALASTAKAAVEQAAAVKELARLAKRRLKQAKKDYKLARRASRKARKEAKAAQAAALAAARKAANSKRRAARRKQVVAPLPKEEIKVESPALKRSKRKKVLVKAAPPVASEVAPKMIETEASAGTPTGDLAITDEDISPLPDDTLE